ncbi:hypothetical protein MHO82_00415 [Vibrio sp. Of7-15]|uniref:hypothetical protein n=1 Tax=Vibrio sp. Of7-15 TaxID=2724879 RepID=UPI001EF23CDD|nr:hypothetical protein [Vibrio sp. Of7-15]MCG7495320.1 hypothetical protein [Vibrio sp. Of7-15]
MNLLLPLGKLCTTVALITLFTFPTLGFANPTSSTISLYHQAAQGNTNAIDVVYNRLTQHLKEHGPTPLTLIYLGSTETLQGRNAWMPWTKLRYTEHGLARMNKALDLLNQQATPVTQQIQINGLYESHLVKAVAGTTFTSVPDFFNHFERGYELYLDLLEDTAFQQSQFEATAWVYLYAIQSALYINDKHQASQWLTYMKQQDPSHLFTQKAIKAVAEAQS